MDVLVSLCIQDASLSIRLVLAYFLFSRSLHCWAQNRISRFGVNFGPTDIKPQCAYIVTDVLCALTEVILQCGQPLHRWSNKLKLAFATSRKMAILKILSRCLLYAQSWNFLCHIAAAVPVLPTDNISPVCRYIFIEIWPVLMALYLKK